MSRELIQFESEEGVFTIESSVDEHLEGEVELVAEDDKQTVVKAKTSLDEALKQIKPATQALFKAFDELNHPSQINLEFGVKIGAKAGVVLASVDSEVTFKVNLTWENKK